jgi:uncharacterized tellurite resistance protein B-like protein
MKESPAFDKSPEFQHFKEVMKEVLAVPKERLDQLLKKAKDKSQSETKRSTKHSKVEPS